MSKDSHYLANALQGECAPGITTLSPGVCSDHDSIDIMKKMLGITAASPAEIIKRAQDKTGCTSESCLYKKISGLGDTHRFAPAGPWKTTTWLSNHDIDSVLAGWCKKYPKFKHVEFGMRDFEKQGDNLARIDLPDLIKNYHNLGCVVNTDWSSGSGEHWTAILIDFASLTVEYFDSAAQTPLPEFSTFCINTAHELSVLTGKKFRDVMVTKVEHQKENTECGVYSLYYILSRLHGVKHSAFEYRRVPDAIMEAFRAKLFRNS